MQFKTSMLEPFPESLMIFEPIVRLPAMVTGPKTEIDSFVERPSRAIQTSRSGSQVKVPCGRGSGLVQDFEGEGV